MQASMVEESVEEGRCQAAIMHLPLLVTANKTHAFEYSAIAATASNSKH